MKGRAPRKGDFYTDEIAFIFLHFFVYFVNEDLKHVKVLLPKNNYSLSICQCNINVFL